MPRPLLAALGLAGLLAAILPMVGFAGFLADFGLPRTVDSGPVTPRSTALGVDLTLLLSFGVVHSVLARPSVKRRMAPVVDVAAERSLYSLVAGLQILLLLLLWRPLPEAVWTVDAAPLRWALWALYGLGWTVVLAALRVVEPGHLFGFVPAWAAARGREAPVPPPLAEGGVYRWLRHPIYAGTLLSFWATPEMSQGHLLLATVFSLYLLVGLRFEERELEREHGERYLAYRRRVAGGLLPRPRAAVEPTDPGG